MRLVNDSAEYLPVVKDVLENYRPEGATGARQVHEIKFPISQELRGPVLDLIGMADVGDQTALVQFMRVAFDHELLKDGKVHTLVLQRVSQDYTVTKPLAGASYQTQQGQRINWAGQFEG